MQLVVDANILLAAFLKEAVTRELLLDSRLSLFAPEHLIQETSRHLNRNASIRRRIGLSDRALQELFSIFFDFDFADSGGFQEILSVICQRSPAFCASRRTRAISCFGFAFEHSDLVKR